MNLIRIALCDIRRVFKDKQIILYWLLMPMGFVYFFGSLSGDRSQHSTWLPVINLDQHEMSQMFIEQLRTPGYNVDIRPATDELYVKYWSRAVIIPATFSQELLTGKKAQCTFTQGKSDFERNLAVQTQLFRTVVKFTGAMAAADILSSSWNETVKQNLQNELQKPQLLTVEKKNHSSLRPPPIGFAFTLPGYLIMFVMINTLMYGGVTLILERTHKQLLRLVAAPQYLLEIFAGKILGRILIPILQSLLLLILGHYLYGVPMGDHPWALAPVIITFALFCGSFSVFSGCFLTSIQQMSGLGILFTMISCTIGGCVFPLEVAPDFMKTVALFSPAYWGFAGMQKVMAFGKTFPDVVPDCLVLATMSLILIGCSLPLFRLNKN